MLSITKPGLFNMLSTNGIHQCFLLCRLTRTPRTRPHTRAHAHAHTENAVPRGSMLFLATPGTTATRPRGRPRPPRRDPRMGRACRTFGEWRRAMRSLGRNTERQGCVHATRRAARTHRCCISFMKVFPRSRPLLPGARCSLTAPSVGRGGRPTAV